MLDFGKFMQIIVLVCKVCHDTVPQTGWLKQKCDISVQVEG